MSVVKAFIFAENFKSNSQVLFGGITNSLWATLSAVGAFSIALLQHRLLKPRQACQWLKVLTNPFFRTKHRSPRLFKANSKTRPIEFRSRRKPERYWRELSLLPSCAKIKKSSNVIWIDGDRILASECLSHRPLAKSTNSKSFNLRKRSWLVKWMLKRLRTSKCKVWFSRSPCKLIARVARQRWWSCPWSSRMGLGLVTLPLAIRVETDWILKVQHQITGTSSRPKRPIQSLTKSHRTRIWIPRSSKVWSSR